MELKWLEDFVMLANQRSFSRAAKMRYVTQPAFSRRIKALENWLGTSLVDRSTYPTTLTDAGRQFRDTAEEVLRIMHEARSEFSNQESRGRATLRFSALHAISLNFFPQWLRAIEGELGERLMTSLMPGNLHDVVSSLVNGNCDFLLCFTHDATPLLLDPQKFPGICLAEEKLILVGPANHKGRPIWDLRLGGADDGIPLLAYSPDCFFGRVQDHILARPGISKRFRPVYENPMAEALKAMALAGQGVAWLPESAVLQELADGRLIEIGDDNYRTELGINLFRAADKNRTQVRRLWHCVEGMQSKIAC
ncbi:LysR family transcriptional regulator [Aestuariispira insulae]|uniref:LysR family transcriptional regulator n=1 Tax=Aestuariispira insulae TaxID=1461337 RepID=A0A3D9H6B5_9PROT|nr:LysR family transcriptional regulator [Aestuariispira insulae]RED45040.1 LysR family transcriptional regulator [Aestuariispira insulae]